MQQQCSELVAKINFLELKDELDDLNKEEMQTRRVCLGEFWKISRFQASLTQQKARVSWLKEGDEKINYVVLGLNGEEESKIL